MKRTERRHEAAHDVADWLDERGEHFRANVVRDVCRSLATANGTLSQLHRDNQDMRNRAQAIEACRAETGTGSVEDESAVGSEADDAPNPNNQMAGGRVK